LIIVSAQREADQTEPVADVSGYGKFSAALDAEALLPPFVTYHYREPAAAK